MICGKKINNLKYHIKELLRYILTKLYYCCCEPNGVPNEKRKNKYCMRIIWNYICGFDWKTSLLLDPKTPNLIKKLFRSYK